MSEPQPSLSEQQRRLLADRLFEAARACAERAEDPPDPSGNGDFTGVNAEHNAKAALALTQAFCTATQPRGTRR